MADERFTEAMKTKEMMTELLACEGWKVLDEVLSAKECILLADFTDEKKDYSDAQLREFRIGLKLIRTIRMTPGTMLAVAEEILEDYAEEEEQNDGEEESRDDSVP